MGRLSLRRFGVVLMSALVLATSFSHVVAPPARAVIANPIPADSSGDPNDTFEADDALFAYFTVDITGGDICVVNADTVVAPGVDCQTGVAWGTPNHFVGLGTQYEGLEAPFLFVGTWRLLAAPTPTVANPHPTPSLSVPFTVSPCFATCDTSIGAAAIAAWKASAGAATEGFDFACKAFAIQSTIDSVSGLAGNISTMRGVLYDAANFATKGFRASIPTATSVAVDFAGGLIAVPELEFSSSEEMAMALLKQLLCSAALMHKTIEQDPPDPDFTTVAQPAFGTIPNPQSDAGQALGVSLDRQRALGEAMLHAYERYLGAQAASQPVYVGLQAQAMADFGLDMAQEMRTSANLLRGYGTLLGADSALVNPVVPDQATLDAVLGIQARIRQDGFLPAELDDLAAHGFTSDEATQIRSQFDQDFSGFPLGVSIDTVLTNAADALDAAAVDYDAVAREASSVASLSNSTPIASFTADPTSGSKPLEVTFTDTSTDPDGDPLTYLWNFDDGTTSTEASPVHTFTDARAYVVRLDVSDGQAGSFAAAVITVTPPGTPPTAYFTVPKYTYLVGDTIHLTDQSTDLEGPIASRQWSDFFGTFSDYAGSETDFTFDFAGTSKIRLDVTDADGWTSSIERAVTSFTALPILSRGGCSSPIAGGGLDSVGNEFMLAFPGNYQDGLNGLFLYIAADVPTTGFVEIPGLGFEQDFSVTPGAATQIVIPPDAHLIDSDLVTANGIRVCADHEVSVYGDNERAATTDAYLGLPTDALGTDYVVMSYPADISHFTETSGERSQLDFVGVADGTNVQITPSIAVGTHPAGVPFTVDLGRFMTYQLRADLDRQDLTGTLIHADHPIAVFGGDSCTDVPAGSSACDHMVEQLAPTRTWGTDFSIVSLEARTGGDLVRVVANQAGTQVDLDGSVVATLGKGEFAEFDLASATTHAIHTSKPTLVAQYAKSLEADGGAGTGDPFMALVTPNAQFADHYTMVSLPGFSNYLNLVTATDDVDSCLVDGAGLTAVAQPIGATGRVGLRQPVDPGSHVVSCPNPFGITAYGWAVFESYGYPGGSRLASIGENQPPIGTPDSYSGPQDTALVVNAATGVLANDSDPDGDPLTATKASDPGHGSLTLNADGSFTYTPNAGYLGPDSFTYTAGDGAASSGATLVSLTIEKTNHDPALAAIDDPTIPEMALFSLTLAGSDPDGDTPLAYSVRSGPLGLVVDTDTGALSWTPTEAQGPGDYPVTVRVTDPDGRFAERSFTIHVLEVNRDPALAAIADQIVNSGAAVSLTAVGSDPDLPANTLTYSLVGGPAGATVGITSGAFAWTASSTLGDYPVTIGVADGVGGSAQRSFTIHVVRDDTTLTLGGDTSGQYSDTATISATLKVGSTGVADATVSIGLGAAVQTATTNASGVASATFPIPGPAASLTTSATFAGTPSKAPSFASGSFTVNREDATIVYDGDTTGLVGATLHLSATFTDSAATGFAGSNPETGAGATKGDITNARIAFAIYNAATCQTGSPNTTLSAFVTDTGSTGDGIGTATVSWSSSSEGTFCVLPFLVGASGSGSNGYYLAPPAEAAGLAVFVDTSGKVSGGGWVGLADGRANFGFNATSNGSKVKGNLVFVERTTYRGTRAILIVKSNAIDALRTSGTTFPITAVLTGKASFKYISALDGSTLFESGNATFSATVVDTGVKGASSGDAFGIHVLDKTGALLADIGTTPLGSGNIVAHLK